MSNQDEMDKLEQDARLGMLQHYSSKASNEAIIIITMAIIFFGFVQSLQFLFYFKNPWITSVYEAFFLWMIVFVTIHSIAKLLRYGYLAESVLTVVISRQDISCLKGLNEECTNKLKENVSPPKFNGYRLLLLTYTISNINSKKGLACILLMFLIIFILILSANGLIFH